MKTTKVCGEVLLAVLLAVPMAAQIYTTSPGLVVPPTGTGAAPCTDGTTQTVSTLSVPDGFIITDVNVLLRISHTFDNDLEVRLTSPASTTVELFTNIDGAGDNFGNNTTGQNTVLDDEAPTDIDAGAAPFIGSFNPEGAVLLAAFDGQNAQGTWTLRVCDEAAADVGTLHFWGLQFNNSTAVPEPLHTTHGHHPQHLHHGQHGHTVGDSQKGHVPGHSAAPLTADEGGFDPPAVMLAALNQDGSPNANRRTLSRLTGAVARPAARGSIVQLFGPAAGLTLEDIEGDPSLISAPADGRLYRTRSLPVVTIAGVRAEVTYSGLAPGLTGTWQINVRIPEGIEPGWEVPAVISYEGRELARKVAIAVE